MSRTRCLVATAGVALLALATACTSATAGPAAKTRALEPVTTVTINHGTLRIRQGSPTTLRVSADKDAMRYVVVREKDGVLELGAPDDSDLRSYILPPLPDDARMDFELTTNDLSVIELGDGEVVVDGYQAPSLRLNANLGHAEIADIDVGDWRCEMVGGVANVVVSGVADTASHYNSSGSTYDDSGLRLRSAVQPAPETE